MECSPKAPKLTILDIPPEVLVEIFDFLTVIEPLGHNTDSFISDSSTCSSFSSSTESVTESKSSSVDLSTPAILGWVKVTHVCTQWRRVALDYSILWGKLVVDPSLELTWIEETLRRSKEAPLDLEVPYAGCYVRTTLEPILLQYTGRIRTLVLEEVSPSISNLLDRPAPNLIELYVSFPSTNRHILPVNLFDNHAPSLQRLTIWDASTFPWTSAAIDSLVHFELESSFHSQVDHPPVAAFFGALARMKALETLILVRHIPNRKSDHSGVPAVIHLPQLKKLRMEADGYDCANVLQRLHLPPNANVEMKYEFPAGPPSHDDVEDIKDKLALDKVFAADGKTRPIQTLEVVYSTYEFSVSNHHIDYYMRIFGWRSVISRQVVNSALLPNFGDDDLGAEPYTADIKVIFDLARQHAPLLAEKTCRALDLRTLRVLSVDISHVRWKIDMYFDVFRDARQVEHLRLVGGSVSENDQITVLDFLQALRKPVAPDADSSARAPTFCLFPRLESLSLLDVNPMFCIDGLASVRDELRELIRDRKQANTPVRTVYIKTRRRKYEGWEDAVEGLAAEIVFEDAFVTLDVSSDSGSEDESSYRDSEEEDEDSEEEEEEDGEDGEDSEDDEEEDGPEEDEEGGLEENEEEE